MHAWKELRLSCTLSAISLNGQPGCYHLSCSTSFAGHPPPTTSCGVIGRKVVKSSFWRYLGVYHKPVPNASLPRFLSPWLFILELAWLITTPLHTHVIFSWVVLEVSHRTHGSKQPSVRLTDHQTLRSPSEVCIHFRKPGIGTLIKSGQWPSCKDSTAQRTTIPESCAWICHWLSEILQSQLVYPQTVAT